MEEDSGGCLLTGNLLPETQSCVCRSLLTSHFGTISPSCYLDTSLRLHRVRWRSFDLEHLLHEALMQLIHHPPPKLLGDLAILGAIVNDIVNGPNLRYFSEGSICWLCLHLFSSLERFTFSQPRPFRILYDLLGRGAYSNRLLGIQPDTRFYRLIGRRWVRPH